MDKVADFILTLLHAATNTHILHWQATRYGEHIALGEFYTGLPELVDQLTEALMGRYEMVPQFPLTYHGPNPDSLQELVTLKEYVQRNDKVSRKTAKSKTSSMKLHKALIPQSTS
jgi:hypothetical protein